MTVRPGSVNRCQNGVRSADVDRVDDRQPVPRGDLDQAELRSIAVFRNELGIESDTGILGNLVTKLLKLVDCIYGLVLQG